MDNAIEDSKTAADARAEANGVVLLIGEDLVLARLLTERLEAKGFSVRCAVHRDATAAAAVWRPLLIVVDGGFDKGKALSTVKQLGSDARTAQLPVAVMACDPEERDDQLHRELLEISDEYWRMQNAPLDVVARIEARLQALCEETAATA